MKQKEQPVSGRPQGLPKGAPYGWQVSGKKAAPVGGDNTIRFIANDYFGEDYFGTDYR